MREALILSSNVTMIFYFDIFFFIGFLQIQHLEDFFKIFIIFLNLIKSQFNQTDLPLFQNMSVKIYTTFFLSSEGFNFKITVKHVQKTTSIRQPLV